MPRKPSNVTRIPQIRIALDMSVPAFAEAVGTSVDAIRSIESGRLAMSSRFVAKVSVATGVSEDWILGKGRAMVDRQNRPIPPGGLKKLGHGLMSGEAPPRMSPEVMGRWALDQSEMIGNALRGPFSVAARKRLEASIILDCRAFALEMRKKYGAGEDLRWKPKGPFERVPENSPHAADVAMWKENQRNGEIFRLRAENAHLREMLAAGKASDIVEKIPQSEDGKKKVTRRPRKSK